MWQEAAMPEIHLLKATGSPPPSYLRKHPSTRPPLRVAAVQERWHADPAEHEEALARGIRLATGEGAHIVFLQELTLSPYFAVTPDAGDVARERSEDIPGGPTTRFAQR